MSDRPDEAFLAIRSESDGEAHLVTVEGEIDGSNAKDLEAVLIRIEAVDESRIVLDLASVQLIDSTGLAVILRAHERAKSDGHRLGVRRPQGHVNRTFELTGLNAVLAFVD